jgi:hypothetical protein
LPEKIYRSTLYYKNKPNKQCIPEIIVTPPPNEVKKDQRLISFETLSKIEGQEVVHSQPEVMGHKVSRSINERVKCSVKLIKSCVILS